MRNVTLLLAIGFAAVLVACSPVGSAEVDVSEMKLQVVGVTHGLGTEVYVQAYRNANPIVLGSGDAFYAKQAGIELEMEETPPLELFNQGRAYHATVTSLADIEIVFRRGNGQVIGGTTFTPVTSSLSNLATTMNVTYVDGNTVNITWNPDGNQSDEVTTALRLDHESCVPSSADFESAAALLELFGPTPSISSDATVADGGVTFDETIANSSSGAFSCDAEQRVYRLAPDEFGLHVASEFEGAHNGSLGAYMHTIPFTWTD